jgi:hypothetical protein
MPGTKHSGNRSGKPRQPGGGRKRNLVVKDRQGNDTVLWRDGDQVAVHDGTGTVATVRLYFGTIKLVAEDGRTLTIIRAE